MRDYYTRIAPLSAGQIGTTYVHLRTASVVINLERAGSGGRAFPSVQVAIDVNGED